MCRGAGRAAVRVPAQPQGAAAHCGSMLRAAALTDEKCSMRADVLSRTARYAISRRRAIAIDPRGGGAIQLIHDVSG